MFYDYIDAIVVNGLHFLNFLGLTDDKPIGGLVINFSTSARLFQGMFLKQVEFDRIHNVSLWNYYVISCLSSQNTYIIYILLVQFDR